MHDIKLLSDWANEAGQLFKAGVILRVSLSLARRLVAEGKASAFGELPPEPAPAATVVPAPAS